MADVVVVGAGLIGLGIAYELAKLDVSVMVLDRDEPARAASWAGAGMLAPFSEELPDAAMLALCRDSLAMYPAFADELRERSGVDVRLRRDGTLHVALDDGRLAELAVHAETYRRNGGDVTMLGRNDVLACETLGVRFERVAEIALECDARRVRGLRTERGFMPAGRVVNAAGAWAGKLDGVPADVRIPVRPVAGEMLAIALPRAAMRAQVWLGHRYLVPRDDGRLLVGATVEERGFDARVTAAGLHDLLDAALALAPALAGFAVVETWAGLRPGSPDGRPFLGATALEGYVVASGHFRNGILLAPITARLIADLIAGGHTDGLAPFAPDRVTAGAPAMAANQSG